ncbi:MAG: acyltransferase family protein [Alphaproteobacteria bacterium]|nr:acyltransferase family protein [Alphaproteobacteria bacterium]
MIWLDNARIAAIAAVVILHVAANVFLYTDLGTPDWWIGNAYNALVRWCVPVFVMISGALLLDETKKESLGTFYGKRVSRILIPLLFWSAIYIFWNMFNAYESAKPLTLSDIVKRIAAGKPHYHMWFLYMIVLLYAFTPFFRKIVASATRAELLLLVGLGMAIAALNSLYDSVTGEEAKLFVNKFLLYTPYFFLGHLIRTDMRRPAAPILWAVFALLAIATALGCYAFLQAFGKETSGYFHSYLSVTVIPMSICVAYLLKGMDRPLIKNAATTKAVASLTLGVYLIHPIFLETLIKFGWGPRSFSPLIAIPGIALAVAGAALLVAWLFSKSPYLRRTI